MQSSVEEIISAWWLKSSSPLHSTEAYANSSSEKEAMDYLSTSILSLIDELKNCSNLDTIPFCDQLKLALQALLDPWSSILKPSISLSSLIEDILKVLPSNDNTCLSLLVPNLSCAPFDEHPVEMSSESSMLIPTLSDTLPPTSSIPTSSPDGGVALNTCATIEVPVITSQKAKRAERKKIFYEFNAPTSGNKGVLSLVDAQIEDIFTQTGGRSRDIRLENFDLDMKGRPIITDGTLSIPFGRRLGLVGRNGVGKSTLLRALANRQLPVPRHLKILHVEQEVIGDDTLAIQSVLEADILLQALLTREKSLESLATVSQDEATRGAALAELTKVHNRLIEIEADSAHYRASLILVGLGFEVEKHTKPTKSFSGGWRMRLALARALFCMPDLLLLDEPTNMLDLPSVAWLSNFLKGSWGSSLVVVSHDRDFLDQVCTDTIHLHHGMLDSYRGCSYSSFVIARSERQIHHEREREANMVYRQSLQSFIDRWRYQASRAALAQSKLKILEKLPVIQPWPMDPPVSFQFPILSDRLPEPMLSIENLSFQYDQDIKFSLNCCLFSAHAGSKIALVGPNGAGKSTFLKLITGEICPKDSNAIFRHGRLKVAYFAQHHVDGLDLNNSALHALATKFGDPGRAADLEEIRRHLGAFGLSGTLALQPIGTLSGGQKSRVVFSALSLQKPHILILDEPTNHLDMDAIDALIIALKAFTGSVLVVSHDVRFVKQLCSELYVCDKGIVKRFPGDDVTEYVSSLGISTS